MQTNSWLLQFKERPGFSQSCYRQRLVTAKTNMQQSVTCLVMFCRGENTFLFNDSRTFSFSSVLPVCACWAAAFHSLKVRCGDSREDRVCWYGRTLELMTTTGHWTFAKGLYMSQCGLNRFNKHIYWTSREKFGVVATVEIAVDLNAFVSERVLPHIYFTT